MHVHLHTFRKWPDNMEKLGLAVIASVSSELRKYESTEYEVPSVAAGVSLAKRCRRRAGQALLPGSGEALLPGCRVRSPKVNDTRRKLYEVFLPKQATRFRLGGSMPPGRNPIVLDRAL